MMFQICCDANFIFKPVDSISVRISPKALLLSKTSKSARNGSGIYENQQKLPETERNYDASPAETTIDDGNAPGPLFWVEA